MTVTITHKYLRNLLDDLSEKNHDDLLMELQYSTLIVPISDNSNVLLIEGRIPLFTDFPEFDKFEKGNKYMPVAHHFNDYLGLLMERRIDGFIINPESESYVISQEILNVMEPNYIFEQDYQPFTVKQIRQIKESIDNSELNEFISDESNLKDMDGLISRLAESTLLTLLVLDDDFTGEAEGGVIWTQGRIPKFIHEIGGKRYLLLFSRDISLDCIPNQICKYSQIVNFPLLVEALLNDDLDGFILNIDEENITIPREFIRNYMEGFNCPLLDDYEMYAFTLEEGERDV